MSVAHEIASEGDAREYTADHPESVAVFSIFNPIRGMDMGTIYIGHEDGEMHVVRVVSDELAESAELPLDHPKREPHTVSALGDDHAPITDGPVELLPKSDTPFVEGVENDLHVEL